jgi:transcription-repair coupling factor (superfamily II helicase)
MLVERRHLAGSAIGEDMRNDISEIAGAAFPARLVNRNIEPACIGDTATQIAEALNGGHIVFLSRDEQRAEATAAALRAAAPESVIVHFPSSDALPGDTAPASPANVGRRVAALRHLRSAVSSKEQVALITTGEAAARLYPRPSSFDAAPPTVKVGTPIDIAAFATQLVEIGYSDDDRVDAPGEIAVRGQVIDIFPADAEMPVRLEISDGRIADIRAFDPASQRGLEALETVEVGRASEPKEPPEVTLFEHFPGASVLLEPGALERRDRFVTLAEDASRRRGDPVSDAADASRWTRALGRVEQRELAARTEVVARRFAEDRSPLRAAARAIKHALGEGQRVLLVGAPRDLRWRGAWPKPQANSSRRRVGPPLSPQKLDL